MFKKFSSKESVTGQSQLKTSVARGIRSTLISQFPPLEDYIDEIIPKKSILFIAKCQNHVNLLVVNNEVLFFNERDGPYYPTLKLLHRCPSMLPVYQVDKGGIKFILSGANVMCPGLTSKGGHMDDVPQGAVVAIKAEGKEHAMAVGITEMSTQDIQKINKGIAVTTAHYLNDGLWKLNEAL
eukprot:TRINITY_DN4727_c0_g1_i1.p1 TRINITY_DN4727_c0_g1~~TRINITY_DN4727_c0_g1_i1.p1  ORF type:complete len:182 (-),score=40.25 TRINITY_DN4727_c0_g1_i1:67-612(-)